VLGENMKPISHFESKVITYIKEYKWHELWCFVEGDTETRGGTLECKQKKIVKDFLLICLWGDFSIASSSLNQKQKNIKDNLSFFLIVLIWIELSDTKKIKTYLGRMPKSLPSWMKSWLEIEILGRSLNFKEQIDFVERISESKNSERWCKVAVLRSTNYHQKDYSYLHEWLSASRYKDEVTDTLNIRSGQICLSQLADNNLLHSLVLNEKARLLFSSAESVEAFNAYEQLADKKYLNLGAMIRWLTLALSMPHSGDQFLRKIDHATRTMPETLAIRGSIITFWLIKSWVDGETRFVGKMIDTYNVYSVLERFPVTKNIQVYFDYLKMLFSHRKEYTDNYNEVGCDLKTIYSFGDSHSLSMSQLCCKINDKKYKCKSTLIMGVKMHHLTLSAETIQKQCFIDNIKSLPPKSNILMCVGEIDTRPDEGIWKYAKEKNIEVDLVIKDTVLGYLDFISHTFCEMAIETMTIQGVPAPAYNVEDEMESEDKASFLLMIKKVNELLKHSTLERGWRFLDIYSATANEGATSHGKWHIDDYHLSPSFYLHMDKWLLPKYNKQTNLTQLKEIIMSEEQAKPAMIKIDDKDYKLEDLSDDAKAQLQGIQVAEAEIKHLNVQLSRFA